MSKVPSIEPFLYKGSLIPDIINEYLVALQEDSSLDSLLVAAKLQEFLSMISDTKFLCEIRSIFDELYESIDRNFPKLCFVLEGRRKSLLSTTAKIYSLLEQNRSLDDIRDIYAFRITIIDGDPQEQVQNCYTLMNRLIPFFIQRGFIPCKANETSDTEDFDPQKMPNIAIPDKSFIEEKHRTSVKDYIGTPKENGYQSLQVAFRDSKTSRCFEIQVRTFSMHVHAESGDACHAVYKCKKYAAINFDPEKVSMPGFRIGPDGRVHDVIGLTSALTIISRQKTLPTTQ